MYDSTSSSFNILALGFRVNFVACVWIFIWISELKMTENFRFLCIKENSGEMTCPHPNYTQTLLFTNASTLCVSLAFVLIVGGEKSMEHFIVTCTWYVHSFLSSPFTPLLYLLPLSSSLSNPLPHSPRLFFAKASGKDGNNRGKRWHFNRQRAHSNQS